MVFKGSKPGVLIIGGIHGDEPSSSALVSELFCYLVEHPGARAGREVILIPQANPDGLYENTRENARGVDLNRNFDTGNYYAGGSHGGVPESEPAVRALVMAIEKYKPSCVVSVHGPLNCIDPDGGEASARLAREMVKVSPLPFGDLETLPGSMGTYVGKTVGLKMITYELDRKYVSASGWSPFLKEHLEALMVAIRKG